MKTKISARYIIGFENNDHVIYENAEMVYEDDKIIFVGFDYPEPVQNHIESGNAIVSPGFIDLNALADIDSTIMNYDQPSSLKLGTMWSKEYVENGSIETFSAEEETLKSRYALTQLIFNGITTALPVTSLLYRKWAETKEEFIQIVDVVEDLGIRVYLGPSYRSAVNVVNQDGSISQYINEELGNKGLSDAIEFLDYVNNLDNDLIRGLLVPSTIETCSQELLIKTKECSDLYQVPIRLHATQSYREFRLINELFGKTPIQYLDSIGFLGKRMILPHAIYLTGYSKADCGIGPDLDILRDTKTIVAHCPFALARSGVAMESFDKFKTMGIRIGMGTDCFPSDMLLNLRLGSLICRQVEDSKDCGTTADFFRAATNWGADALGRADLGRLEPQAKADFFIASLDGFHIGQVDDPIRTLILNGNSTDIITVVINGTTVLENREIQGLNKLDLSISAQLLYEKYKRSFTKRDYLEREPDILFPNLFKMENVGDE